jgi:hypothetical protein
MLYFANDGDMPPERILQIRRVDDLPLQRARKSRSHAPDPGNLKESPLASLDYRQLFSLNAERVVTITPAKRREASASEEVREGFIEIAESLVQRSNRDSLEPFALPPQNGHVAPLGYEVQADTMRQGLPPKVPSLFKCEIIDEAHRVGLPLQSGFLFWRRVKSIPKRALDHGCFSSRIRLNYKARAAIEALGGGIADVHRSCRSGACAL